MSLFILVSSINWSVNFHYCGDTWVNFSFIGEAESCGMEELDEVCTYSRPGTPVMNKNCCSNIDLIFEGEETARRFISEIDAFRFVYLTYSTFNLELKSSYLDLFSNPHFESSPPWLHEEIITIFQVYLI